MGMRPNGVRRDLTVSCILCTSITIKYVSTYEPIVFFDKIFFPP